MNLDFSSIATNIQRGVRATTKDGKSLRSVTLSCDLKAAIDPLWIAITHKDVLEKWFQPVTGELRLNGRFQIQDNTAGTVVSCEIGESYSITWEFAGDTSWVDVSLVELDNGSIRLSISHTMNFSEHWTHYGPGATGVGWELSLYGLAFFLLHPDEQKFDEAEFVSSQAGRAMVERSSEGWAEAGITSGIEPNHALQAARRTTAFYTGVESE